MTQRFFCYLLALVLSFSTSHSAWAQEHEEQMRAADYKRFYDQLNENISRYNQINDSLFGLYTKEEWVKTYLRRARITSQIGQENQAIINHYKPFFKKDTLTSSFLEALTDTTFNILPDLHDDFLNEELLEYLLQKEEKLKTADINLDEQYISTQLKLALNKYFTAASGDAKAREESLQIFRDILNHQKPGRDIELTPATATYYIKTASNFGNLSHLISQGQISIEEMNQYMTLLSEVLDDTVFCKGVPTDVIKGAKAILNNMPASMLRNVFIPDTTHRYDAIKDSLMIAYVNLYDQNPDKEAKLSLINKKRITLMRYQLKRYSTMQALEVCNRLVDSLSVKLENETQLKDKFNCILECIYYIDLSNLSFEKKREKIKAYCDAMLDDLANFHYVNKMPQLVTSLSNIASYGRIHKYLLPEERKEFLKELLFFSQPFTRAHSETVTHLGLTILQSVIEHQPELLIGVKGYKSKSDVKKHKKQLMEFFHDGALFHDLGKTQMPDIIRNEYRQLNDHEFSIIRHHPDFGVGFLQVDPSLQKLQDFIIGHHKWYDGKGGYPASFDNTKSEIYVLIDILTLADCLEAATSRLGRNYRKNKHYGDVIKEFQAEAGTRYNPYLVKHIEDHPQLGKQLEEICEKGWEDIYYNVFISHVKK